MVLDFACLGVRIIYGFGSAGFTDGVVTGAGGRTSEEYPISLADDRYFGGRVDSHDIYGHYGAVLAI